MMIPLGAINKKTREYVYPKNANKKDEYCCPECDKDLIYTRAIFVFTISYINLQNLNLAIIILLQLKAKYIEPQNYC